MEFVLGSVSSVGAGLFSNPLDVLKTKAQLQGELRKSGKYNVHYKNMFHAAYVISKEEGVMALQKGLVSALFFQVALNGTRLGLFQVAENYKLTQKDDGSVSIWKTMIISSISGSLGAFIGSPFYLVKTQIQSQAPIAVVNSNSVALGHQHKHTGTFSAFKQIYNKAGIPGLWVGATGSMLRVAIGSCAQLSTFSSCKEFISNQNIFAEDAVWSKAFASSMMVGIVTAIVMSPFDTISTRLYNQKRDASGKGILYSGILDCLNKTYRCEGIRGLYKGLLPCYFRIGPHSMLNLMFWDKLKDMYMKYNSGS